LDWYFKGSLKRYKVSILVEGLGVKGEILRVSK